MTLITDVLTQARKKQQVMAAVLERTKEIDGFFMQNNADLADQSLDARMEQIQEAMACDEAIGKLLDGASLAESLKLEKIGRLQIQGMELSEEERLLYEVYKDTQSIASRTVDIDKKISQRIIGKSSVYGEK